MTTTYSIAFGQTNAVRVEVAVVDPARHYDTLFAAGRCDLLVIGGATPDLVAAARLMHPEAAVIAVIDAQAPVEPLIAILAAGADACVRAGATAVLAGHLIASNRRRMGTRHSQRQAAA